MLWAFVISAIIAGGVFVWLHRSTSGGGRFASEAVLRARLRQKVMGNDGAVDRLVDAERRRRPEASEPELIRAAIQRLDRDRR